MFKLFIVMMAAGQIVAEAEHPYEFLEESVCYEFGAEFMVTAPHPEFQIYGECRKVSDNV